jgi:hypothetical protein
MPWERLLWRSRSWRPARRAAGERYLLTDLRLVRITREQSDDLALDDIRDVRRTETRADRIFGTSTLTITSQRHGPPIVLHGVRRGQQLAVLLEILARDPDAPRDPGAVRAALAWEPGPLTYRPREALAGFFLMLVVMATVVFGLHGRTAAAIYAPDDAIAPNGAKRERADIVRFMEHDVMPWAREALGPMVGGSDRVTCNTCHGAQAYARDWRMPGVARLPQPDVRERGFEIYNRDLDAEMRNAIYGYLAGSDNQTKATHMREVVLPGMARLLHRPAYDFTQSYAYNRSRRAVGCYHCHQVQ